MELRNIYNCIFLSVSLLIVACSSTKEKEVGNLGKVEFKYAGSKEALVDFEKGLLLLHSFEYEDAREAFKKAQQADPKCLMAYWGEAMTYNHSLWSEQDLEKAQKVLSKIKKANVKTEKISDIEKDFIKSIHILYGEGTKLERDQDYADFMTKMYKKNPGNNEIASFYALSLLGSVPEGRDDKVYEQGAAIVQSILKENPHHPGALHYLIHSYDDPKHAFQALQAANNYSKVAPDAAHALHMPSHIYVALGMWDEVVSSNEVSFQASIDRKNRKKLDNNAYGYHSMHWLLYGYLQKGEIEKANQLMADIAKYSKELPSSRARSHLLYMTATYLVESNDWNNKIADTQIKI